MNTEQAEFIRRIRDFQFDDPQAVRPFSRRLAQEQGWTPAFTIRAIEEYRRFVALAATVGRVVCPSPVVDEVWHLHLLYTRDYWQRFCGATLGRPLHHEPSRGGPEELTKHREMYAATLSCYHETFDEVPPDDIWPALDSAFPPPPSVPPGLGTATSGTPRRKSVMRQWSAVAVGGLLPLLAIGPGIIAANANPFDLAGPEFLVLYAILFCLVFATGLMLRYRARRTAAPPEVGPLQLDPYETAYLSGGTRRAVTTALMNLVRTGHLEVVKESPPRFSQTKAPTNAAPLMERQVYQSLAGEPHNSSLQVVLRMGEEFCEPLRQRLANLGLVASDRDNWWGTVAPFLLVAALLAFGGVKIAVGIERHRPVSFLVFGCFATLILAVIAFGRRLHRTWRGDHELSLLKERHAELHDSIAGHDNDSADSAFPLAIGLFGLGLLTSTSLGSLARALEHSPSGLGSGGGCGGGGCGGGGCGGGGCGGCSG